MQIRLLLLLILQQEHARTRAQTQARTIDRKHTWEVEARVGRPDTIFERPGMTNAEVIMRQEAKTAQPRVARAPCMVETDVWERKKGGLPKEKGERVLHFREGKKGSGLYVMETGKYQFALGEDGLGDVRRRNTFLRCLMRGLSNIVFVQGTQRSGTPFFKFCFCFHVLDRPSAHVCVHSDHSRLLGLHAQAALFILVGGGRDV